MTKPELIIKHGCAEMVFETFNDYLNYMTEDFINTPAYIFRGQQHNEWKVTSTLFRKLHENGYHNFDKFSTLHLDNFKYSIRGRFNNTFKPIDEMEDNELWSIGQHYGLATPLIDWSYSPFIAAFFAFENPDITDQSDYRSIYCIHKIHLEEKIEQIKKDKSYQDYNIEFVSPMRSYSSRLINQRGLFTKIPLGTDLQRWVDELFFKEDPKKGFVFAKIKIKNSERENTLKILSRMNINHFTLYPDLTGSSMFSNMSLEIRNYSYNT